MAAIGWSSLNQAAAPAVDSAPAGETLEARGARRRDAYTSALRLHGAGQTAEALARYTVLVDELRAVALPDDLGRRLLYAALRNRADLCAEAGDADGALRDLCLAGDTDPSDITLWHALATAARAAGRLKLARYAAERAVSVGTGPDGQRTAMAILVERTVLVPVVAAIDAGATGRPAAAADLASSETVAQLHELTWLSLGDLIVGAMESRAVGRSGGGLERPLAVSVAPAQVAQLRVAAAAPAAAAPAAAASAAAAAPAPAPPAPAERPGKKRAASSNKRASEQERAVNLRVGLLSELAEAADDANDAAPASSARAARRSPSANDAAPASSARAPRLSTSGSPSPSGASAAAAIEAAGEAALGATVPCARFAALTSWPSPDEAFERAAGAAVRANTAKRDRRGAQKQPAAPPRRAKTSSPEVALAIGTSVAAFVSRHQDAGPLATACGFLEAVCSTESDHDVVDAGTWTGEAFADTDDADNDDGGPGAARRRPMIDTVLAVVRLVQHRAPLSATVLITVAEAAYEAAAASPSANAQGEAEHWTGAAARCLRPSDGNLLAARLEWLRARLAADRGDATAALSSVAAAKLAVGTGTVRLPHCSALRVISVPAADRRLSALNLSGALQSIREAADESPGGAESAPAASSALWLRLKERYIDNATHTARRSAELLDDLASHVAWRQPASSGGARIVGSVLAVLVETALAANEHAAAAIACVGVVRYLADHDSWAERAVAAASRTAPTASGKRLSTGSPRDDAGREIVVALYALLRRVVQSRLDLDIDIDDRLAADIRSAAAYGIELAAISSNAAMLQDAVFAAHHSGAAAAEAAVCEALSGVAWVCAYHPSGLGAAVAANERAVVVREKAEFVTAALWALLRAVLKTKTTDANVGGRAYGGLTHTVVSLLSLADVEGFGNASAAAEAQKGLRLAAGAAGSVIALRRARCLVDRGTAGNEGEWRGAVRFVDAVSRHLAAANTFARSGARGAEYAAALRGELVGCPPPRNPLPEAAAEADMADSDGTDDDTAGKPPISCGDVRLHYKLVAQTFSDNFGFNLMQACDDRRLSEEAVPASCPRAVLAEMAIHFLPVLRTELADSDSGDSASLPLDHPYAAHAAHFGERRTGLGIHRSEALRLLRAFHAASDCRTYADQVVTGLLAPVGGGGHAFDWAPLPALVVRAAPPPTAGASSIAAVRNEIHHFVGILGAGRREPYGPKAAAAAERSLLEEVDHGLLDLTVSSTSGGTRLATWQRLAGALEALAAPADDQLTTKAVPPGALAMGAADARPLADVLHPVSAPADTDAAVRRLGLGDVGARTSAVALHVAGWYLLATRAWTAAAAVAAAAGDEAARIRATERAATLLYTRLRRAGGQDEGPALRARILALCGDIDTWYSAWLRGKVLWKSARRVEAVDVWAAALETARGGDDTSVEQQLLYRVQAARAKLLLSEEWSSDPERILAAVERYPYDADEDPESTAVATNVAARRWAALSDAVEAFEYLRKCDKYDPRPVYRLAVTYARAGAMQDAPAGYGTGAARAVLATLFDRKRPQVVAMWRPEARGLKDPPPFLLLAQDAHKHDAQRLRAARQYVALLVAEGDEPVLATLSSWAKASSDASCAVGLIFAAAVEGRLAVYEARAGADSDDGLKAVFRIYCDSLAVNDGAIKSRAERCLVRLAGADSLRTALDVCAQTFPEDMAANRARISKSRLKLRPAAEAPAPVAAAATAAAGSGPMEE